MAVLSSRVRMAERLEGAAVRAEEAAMERVAEAGAVRDAVVGVATSEWVRGAASWAARAARVALVVREASVATTPVALCSTQAVQRRS